MSHSIDSEFGAIRSFLWPIRRDEMSKFFPMLLMLFLVCFNYSILRCLKDTLVITASGSADVIPFLKVWVILPAALVSTLLFANLVNRFGQEKVFYIVVGFFLGAFLFFAFILYPLRARLYPHGVACACSSYLPAGFKGMVSMCCYWMETGFYVLSEIWGSLVMSVMFWGIANEVTKITEARRFYSVFSIWSNVATIAAGQLANYFTVNEGQLNLMFPFGNDHWEQTIMLIVLLVVVAGIGMMGAFYWMNKNVLNKPMFEELHKSREELRPKKKASLRDSFSFLSNSKYLSCIAVIVIGYNLTINLAEVLWKDQVKVMYPSPTDYNSYLNNVTSMTGVISTLVALFMARIMARCGWTKTAMITPVIMLATSIGFFAFMIFQESIGPLAFALTGVTPLAFCIFFGAAQNSMSKAMKYSVFDATKEMAFIPLDHESKLKGKAAIDGVGSRFGKFGGSLLFQTLLVLFVTLPATAPYIALMTLFSVGGWLFAVRSLGKQFAGLAGGERTLLFSDEELPKDVKEKEQPQTA